MFSERSHLDIIIQKGTQAVANTIPYKPLSTDSLLSVGRAGLQSGLHVLKEIDVLSCVGEVSTRLPKRPEGRGPPSVWLLIFQTPV